MSNASYSYRTRKGVFKITQLGHDGWRIYHESDLLDGPFVTLQQALDELSGGSVPSLSDGTSTDDLDVPDDISEWSNDR